MQLRSVRVLIFCTLFAIFCAYSDTSAAQPVLRAGQGCGWDYPCPPDPGFGRVPGTPGSQVIIHNNYGQVNVYPGGGPHPERHEGKDERGCRDGEYRWGCETSLNAEKCGPLCWMRRFREGYCGHGCFAYREQARAEAEERAEEAERQERKRWEKLEHSERDENFEKRAGCASPYCGGNYPPPPLPPYYRDSPERAYAPPRHPERAAPPDRFEGPRYPANCPRGGC
jgi:hypothetical protein